MYSNHIDLLRRTWKIYPGLKLAENDQLELEAAAAQVLISTYDEFPDFVQYWQEQNIERCLAGAVFGPDEYLIALHIDDRANLTITNRQLLYGEAAENAGDADVLAAYLVADIASCERIKGGLFQKPSLRVTMQDGGTLDCAVADRALVDAVNYALSSNERDWSEHYQQDEEDYQASLAAFKAEQSKDKQAQTDSQEEEPATGFDIPGPIIGTAAAVVFLLVNGAPLFDGGPAMLRWMSSGNNEVYLFGAIALGFLSPMFMPRG